MAYNTIDLEVANRVARITINRPQALNALNQEVLHELDQAIDQILAEDVGVAIITGSGEKAFVAGADIKEIHELNTDTAKTFAERGQRLFLKIEQAPIPFIAAVNGFALGGGLELAMACDFIYASSKGKLGLPECTLGLIPGFGGTVRLARKVGPGLAKEWTMTGNILSAEEALRVGLVNKICEPQSLLSEAQKVAETILSRAPLAIQGIKTLINQTYGLEASAAMGLEAREFAKLFAFQDVREGTSAFIEKRQPQFKGK